MADRKVPTTTLHGNEYASVPERIKLFREDCPRGSIQTSFTTMEDGQISFTATVVKERGVEESAIATGHSLGPVKGDKSFEKLETVAIGRALAILGYLASGDVASAEEMELFLEHQARQKEEAIVLAIDNLEDATTLEQLKKTFISLGILIKEPEIVKAKDRIKKKLLNEDKK